MSNRPNPYKRGAGRPRDPVPPTADGAGPSRLELLELEQRVAALEEQVSKGAAALAALQAAEQEARALVLHWQAKIKAKPMLAALLR